QDRPLRKKRYSDYRDHGRKRREQIARFDAPDYEDSNQCKGREKDAEIFYGQIRAVFGQTDVACVASDEKHHNITRQKDYKNEDYRSENPGKVNLEVIHVNSFR